MQCLFFNPTYVPTPMFPDPSQSTGHTPFPGKARTGIAPAPHTEGAPTSAAYPREGTVKNTVPPANAWVVARRRVRPGQGNGRATAKKPLTWVLIPNVAESDSRKVKPTEKDVEKLFLAIKTHRPKVVCILHSKVFKALSNYMLTNFKKKVSENYGPLGYLIPRSKIRFYLVPFPHGNKVPDGEKVKVYKQIKRYLSRRKLKLKKIASTNGYPDYTH